MDKERLYEENLNLKNLYNIAIEENTRLKTRVTQLENEIGRNNGMLEQVKQGRTLKVPGGVHLIQSLKAKIKELQVEATGKAKELDDLKRSVKATSFKEMQEEVKVHQMECKRLRHMIEELL